MIANLPLLFAGGSPTALKKITDSQLERFITFMVHCSWGHDTVNEIKKPAWWPDDVKFSDPFRKPPETPRDWSNKLRNIVKSCYDFHKSSFLLKFSEELSNYPRNKLSFVDNRDHTTSLYLEPGGQLLVTFRNENLFYDRAPRKTLIRPKKPQKQIPIQQNDIYLCDTCDSHFNNETTLQNHERLCSRTINEHVVKEENPDKFESFLLALNLKPAGQTEKPNEKRDTLVTHKGRHLRAASNIDRGPAYPFSSLAGLRNARSVEYRENSYSRERIERYCATTPVNGKIKLPSKSHSLFPSRYRRPTNHWNRQYKFPLQRNKTVLDLKGQLCLLKCKPVRVSVEKMSEEKMKIYLDHLSEIRRQKLQTLLENDIEFVSSSKNEVSQPEVIDLCSDEERAEDANENKDPRASGTAVWWRACGEVPRAQPAPPCGASRCCDAPIHPKPKALYAHSLHNIHFISLD